MTEPTHDTFAPIIERFTDAARTAFAAHLAVHAPNLDADEMRVVRAAADEALRTNARLKLNRVLLLELHAAKRAGELTAADDDARFAQFVARASQPEFGEHLDRRYPPLRSRLQHALDLQRGAIESLIDRLVADRAALTSLLGRPAGRLIALGMGQGDLHDGGQAVARVTFDGGDVMYKPRSLRIDAVLDAFLAHVFRGDPERIRVPATIDRGAYGWAAFVTHRHCDGDVELDRFYIGLGHWLGVLRLLGGTDIHHENLIAAGPVPVVIDVESLFAVIPPSPVSAYGDAYDAAQALIRSSVLRTGIVPYRAPALGFDGVDVSAAGALPGQQPQVHLPIIDAAGTTDARVRIIDVDRNPAQNHPSAAPNVAAHWDRLSEGFVDACRRIAAIDARGELEPRLAAFEGCRIRDIRRPTQAYAEIGRMLWHPASLHDEAAAIERARDLFERNAAVVPVAPSSAHEIAAEVDDLRHGDIPVFAAPLTRERIAATLADWRAMRIDLEELTIRSALVTTELNSRLNVPDERNRLRLYYARNPHAEGLEPRRRKLAADAVERLLRLAVRGSDGSVTWITPETTHAGWLVQPLQHDIYFGLGGVVVALAGYRAEVARGRADAVDGIDAAIEGSLQILRALNAGEPPRVIGGFNGYGGQIWTWLVLHDVLDRPELLAHAQASAAALERAGFDDDRRYDILDGTAGVIVPLIELAGATGDVRWLALAARAGRYLEATAIVDTQRTLAIVDTQDPAFVDTQKMPAIVDTQRSAVVDTQNATATGDTQRARWPSTVSDEPVGGFAHGAAGTAWALARLALSDAGDASDRVRWRALADAAFAFQDSLYDTTLGNWLDQRQWTRDETFHTWCNGSVGIGLAAADLYARTNDAGYRDMLRRAVAASRDTWGASHTLCHGDFSLWELIVRAAELDPEACAADRIEPTARVVSAVEEHRGVIVSTTHAAFTPGLMTGLAGAVHGFNRMHPDCTLPSPLLQERRVQAV